jgi:hypothetical protein
VNGSGGNGRLRTEAPVPVGCVAHPLATRAAALKTSGESRPQRERCATIPARTTVVHLGTGSLCHAANWLATGREFSSCGCAKAHAEFCAEVTVICRVAVGSERHIIPPCPELPWVVFPLDQHLKIRVYPRYQRPYSATEQPWLTSKAPLARQTGGSDYNEGDE